MKKKFYEFLCKAKHYCTASTPSGLAKRLVKLPLGTLQGIERVGIYGDKYYAFEGIPYAKPPLGALRFRAPEPACSWTGTLDCTQERNVPLQVDRQSGTTIGAEDCLFVNVYTKQFDTTKPLPVLVWIYGGAFRSGGATCAKYGPDYLMRKDVVLVTFNYRLGPLGFLSLMDQKLDVPGNAGLKDQVLALKWIKQNICHFNGDAENITLFGESAGAACVHFMLCTPQTRGLFHRAVLMSGCMLNPWVEVPQARILPYQLALQYGFSGIISDECVLKFLDQLKPKCLVQHSLLNEYDTIAGRVAPFVPTVEPYESAHTLISVPYVELQKSAWGNDIPVIIGGTSFEGLSMYPYVRDCWWLVRLFNSHAIWALPSEIFKVNSLEDNERLAAELIKHHYGPKLVNKMNVLNFLDFYSYKLFWHGIHRTVLARLTHATAPTYLYRFDFDSPTFNLSRINICGDDIKVGVCHADDLAYIFAKKNAWKLAEDSMEYRTIRRMVGILTSFAKNSNPNCAEIEPAVWQPLVKKDPFRVLNISYEVSVIKQPEKDGLDVWNKVFNSNDCVEPDIVANK